MKKIILVVALAVALTFAFTASAYATSAKTWNYETDYYTWGSLSGNNQTPPALSAVGANPSNPGVHANYLANTAKCGICHSVHRAKGDGVKLLNSGITTCAGCHRAGTGTITTKLVSWETGGPHSSGTNASCTARTCHTNSPHGVGVSTYKLLASKLIHVNADAELALAISNSATSGITAAEVNMTASTWSDAQKDAVITGYTCNQTGCHEQTVLTVIQKGDVEQRWNYYPDTTPGFAVVGKTGHMSVAAADANHYSYNAVAGCTSCHDQQDAATTTGFTFPHSQTPYDKTASWGTGRAYLWMGYAGDNDTTLTPMGSGDKAFDGACLKCHRDNATTGIGASF